MLPSAPMDHQQASWLAEMARQVMIDQGLDPDYDRDIEQQVTAIKGPATADGEAAIRDMRSIVWCSIDNDDSRDLDQLTYAERKDEGTVRMFVAVADVDALVKKD